MPAEVTVESTSILEVVIDLFGGDSSSEAVQPVPEVAPTQPPVPVALPVNPVSQSPPSFAETQLKKVEIQTTYADAVRESQLHNRPVLAVLGADWCAWCRKLEAELETPAAESILKEWVVVKVNVDNEPEVATRLQASALPALRVLGPFQSLVASREGYVELAELKQWLAANRASADPALHKVLYDAAAPDKAAVAQLISMLAQSSPMVRSAAMERLAAHPRRSADPLVQILKTGRLAQQLCACDVLRRWSAPLEGIDPWQPETLQTDEFDALLEWARDRLEALGAEQAEAPEAGSKTAEAANTTPVDSAEVNELLGRLMTAELLERPGLIAQLTGSGAALAAEVRSRLAQSDAVDDLAREALRELLYNVLASSQLRLQHAGQLAALARLDSESHRQAAAGVLDQASILDQPLVDELAQDTDPLVRELSVRALGRLGLLTDGGHIEQLLADSSPNVRTAVLRALSEHPSEQAIEALCEYLEKETDEDLLVHGAKCLGQLARQPQAMATLARLAGNSSWRVRATAIEAAGQAIQNVLQQGQMGNSSNGLVPEALAKAIVTAAFEEDAFVAERAGTLLPKLLNTGVVDETTLQTIAKSLADHPEKLESLVSNPTGKVPIPPAHARQQSYPALVNVAKQWLTREDAKDIERAAILLSRFDPTALNDRLSTLISSKDRAMRMAGLRAAIDSLENYRRTSIEAAVRAWRTHSDEAHPRRQPPITPWYETPGAEAAAQATETSHSTSQSAHAAGDVAGTSQPALANSPQPGASALDATSEIFGDFPTTEVVKANARTGQPAQKELARLALPSKWLEYWQSGSAQNRPAWLSACEEPTRALFESADSQERTAALALWLMLGHVEHTSDLLAAVTKSNAANQAGTSVIKLPQVVSWLPGEQRLAACKQLVAAHGADSEQIIQTLEQITVVDDNQLAAWLFESLGQESFSDPKREQQLTAVLLRALLGFAAEALPGSLSPGDFQFSDKAPFEVQRSRKLFAVPGRIQACEWLRKRYRQSTSDRQRAIALLAVARLDHKTAVDAAIAAVNEAERDSQLLQAALSIALCDAAIPSAERAVMLLEHDVFAVRRAALQQLALPAQQFRNSARPLLPAVNENPSILPGFWRSAQKVPTKVLRDLVDAQSDPVQQSQAILLLLAAGEAVDLAPLERQLSVSHGEFTKLSIAAALAKAGRTDDEAVKYYEQVYAESSTRAGGGDDRIASALYEALRDLGGDRVAELRRRMRNEKGASLFNQNMDTDFNVTRP